jgi:N,N'-diacetyllegionaminate synthase
MTAAVKIIAEAGVNHNGDVALAERLIDAAGDAGADCVKFQTFDPEALAAPVAQKAAYQIATTGADQSQLDMLRGLALSPAVHERLMAYCRARGITFLSTPFDIRSADLLRNLGVSAFKISSGDLTNLPLLEHVAQFGKPMIVSTGMADLEEVRAAVHAIRSAGSVDLTLMQCVTDYPADPADANLRAMTTMVSAFGVPVGYSDHTPGIAVAIAAAALGATVIEKHITVDRRLPGPDQAASLEPAEFAAMVAGIRTATQALGTGEKAPSRRELLNRGAARRSLVAARDIALGVAVARQDLAILRPGTGLSPARLGWAVGRRLNRSAAAGTVLTEDMFE